MQHDNQDPRRTDVPGCGGDEMVATNEWHLTPTEQAKLLRVLATAAPETPAFRAAARRAAELFER